MSERFAFVEVLGRRVELLAADDPDATRLIYAIVIALLVIGAALVVLAVWVIRRTRADLELLAPLERMSESRWRKSDSDARRSLLNEVRPAGAAAVVTPVPDAAPHAEFPPPTVAPVVPVADTITDAEVAPDVEPDVESEVAPDVEPDVESEVAPDVEPDIQSEVVPDVEPDIQSEVVPDVEPDVQSEVVPDVEPDIELDGEADTEPGTENDPETGIEPDDVGASAIGLVEAPGAAADDAVAEH